MKQKYLLLYITALIASLGGMLSGFDTGVISGALLYINQDWNLSASLQGFLVSAVLVGAFLGAALNGFLADYFGRKKILIITAVIFFAGSIMCALSSNVYILIFSRIFTGFAVGIAAFVTPLYLSEVSPPDKRGMLVSLYQLAITAGILFSYFVNAIFAHFEHGWRLMLLVGVVPAAILFFGMLFLDDTPRWLVSKGLYDRAKELFKRIEPSCDAELEVKNIQETIAPEEKIAFKKWMIMPFIVGIGIMFAQICTGVNTIIYYAPTIFKIAGFSSNISAIYATGIIGIVNFLMTFVAIKYSDKAGRKPLLYLGLSGILFSLVLLSFVFSHTDSGALFVRVGAFFSLIFYIVCFSFSLGPVGMILVSEVFPLKIRGFAMSVCLVANFVFNFLITFLFPISLQKFGAVHTFLFFALVAVICIIFVYFIVPETKGITLENIESNWIKGTKPRDF